MYARGVVEFCVAELNISKNSLSIQLIIAKVGCVPQVEEHIFSCICLK
jgi:hypothetical protein